MCEQCDEIRRQVAKDLEEHKRARRAERNLIRLLFVLAGFSGLALGSIFVRLLLG